MKYTSRLPRMMILLGSWAFALLMTPLSVAKAAPVNVIFDTDMTSDVDDAGALAELNKLTCLGEAQMLACVTDDRDRDKAIAATITAINTYYGHPNVPIGTNQNPKYGVIASYYTAHIRDEFAKSVLPDDQQPTALDVYRKTLAAAPDGSVTIVTVGFLINLSDLLKSPPDAISPLSGMDLVKKKVRNLVTMGGQYPSGNEWNFRGNGVGADTQYVVENWPTPILFSGYEIGGAIMTDTRLASAPANDPVRQIYGSFKGHPSWDLTAVLAAVRDPKLYWNMSADGYNQVMASGANHWSPTPNRGQSYLIRRLPPADMGAILDNLITLPPGPSR